MGGFGNQLFQLCFANNLKRKGHEVAVDTSNYNYDYRFSYEIIAQSFYLKLKIDSVPVRCDYNNQHTTMPLSRAIPCIIHALKIGLHYRLAKLGKKFSIFKI